MVRYRFALSVRYMMRDGRPINARWHDAGELAQSMGVTSPADRYRLLRDLIQHARSFVYWDRAGAAWIPFRGWLISRAFFEQF